MTYKIPISPYAETFYTEWKLFPKKSNYNIVFDQTLDGYVDVSRLNYAIQHLASDYVILNSHIEEDSNGKLFWIKNITTPELEFFSDNFDDEDVLLYAQKPFNLSQGPLYRFGLFKNSDFNYRLVVVLHHISIDGSLFDIFCEELSNYYNCKTYKPKISKTEQLVRMAGLFESQRKYLNVHKEKIKLFWKNKLLHAESIDLRFLKTTHIGNNCSREGKYIHKSLTEIGELRFSFDSRVLLKLNKLSGKYSITSYWYSKNLFALLIHKLTACSEFCISYPTAIKKGTDLIYGAQVNVNIIPYNFNTINNFYDLICQTKEFMKSVKHNDVDHSYLPINEILSRLNKQIMNVSFVNTNLKDRPFELKKIKATINHKLNIDLSNELSFEYEIRDNKINYRIKYRANKIDLNLLKEFSLLYQNLFLEILDEISNVDNPAKLKNIKYYKLLSRDKYQRIIYDWNQTYAPFSENKTIVQLFEEQVKRTPNNMAVLYADVKLTYQQLNEKANQLSNYLRNNCGVELDAPIALCLDRSEHMLIAILATLKAGSCYVPIDPEYPNNRITYILSDTEAKILLTSESHRQELEYLNRNVSILAIDSDNLQSKLSLEAKGDISVAITSSNLAYIIYTSGTTGEPKGVMIEHKGIINRIEWMNAKYPINEKDRILQKTPYMFDVSVWELLWGLWYGASIVFAKPGGHKDPNYLINIMNMESITICHFVPSMLNAFIDALQDSVGNLKCLKYIFSSGEVLNLKQVRDCHKLLPNVEVHNFYGPTEASIDVTYYDCTDKHINNICIGRPINNTVCYVLDKNLHPLPLGAVGELYIGGVGLARGYLNKKKLTAESFVNNPFQTEEEKIKGKYNRLYNTKDLVRWLPDGNLEYIGRNGSQIKIRGYRIELSEVESVLSSYPGVKQSIVLVKEKESINDLVPQNKYLLGYYLSNKQLNHEDIMTYLKSSLPEYMIPVFLIRLKEIPLTINGKLDKNALPPEPVFLKSNNYTAPRSNLEKRICRIIAEVLALPTQKISLSDNFFNLGGDSILGLRLVARINKEFDLRITISNLLESTSIANLIKEISLSTAVCKQVSNYVYTPFCLVNSEHYKDVDSIDDIYPASYLQVGMLLESSLDHYQTYHDVFIYPIKIKYDQNKLLTIWQELIAKNELLRGAFFLTASGWNLAIHNSININYSYHLNCDTYALVEEERKNQFRFHEPGLFRIIINDFGNNFELLFSFHHAIADGWSVAFLIYEFIQAYTQNKPIKQEVNLYYGEFVQTELCAVKNQATIDFWKRYLEGARVVKLNADLERDKSTNGLHVMVDYLDSLQVELVKKISKNLSISIDTIFLFIYLKTIAYFTKASEGMVGLVVNNRLEKENADMLFGLFLNTVPFRYNFHPLQGDTEILLELFNQKNKLQKYKQLPYGYIKSLFKKTLYDFSFNFINFHILSDCLDDMESFVGYERTSIPFVLNVSQYKDTVFSLRIAAHDNYVSRSFLQKFITYYIKHLTDFLDRF